MLSSAFDDEWRQICEGRQHGSFEYGGSITSIRKAVDAHFPSGSDQQRYGVYIVRAGKRVLYVGKAGTIQSDGKYKNQGVPGRLKNTKGTTSAQAWIDGLYAANGPLVIEYVLLESKPMAPALAEAMLLQAFLNEHGRLPSANSSL